MSESRIGILYLIDMLDIRGGTEINLQRLTTHLDQERYYPVVCPMQPTHSAMIDSLRENSVEVVPLDLHSIFGIKAFKTALLIRSLIKSKQIKIVQTIHFGSDIMGALCKRFWRRPVIISSRRDMGFNETKWTHRMMRRLTSGRVDRVLTNSIAMRDHIAAQEKIPLAKFFTIYNGVEIPELVQPSQKEALRSQWGFTANDFIIGCVANIQPIKGFEYLIEAVSRLSLHDLHVHLLLVGGIEKKMHGTENYYDHLNSLVAEKNLESRVHFIGSRTDVLDLVSIMNLFVLPSLSEGFSNAIIEAMAASIPVVATDVGGNGEAVKHGVTGLLVPPADPQAIEEAIAHLFHNPSLREQMGKDARQFAKKHFAVGQMVRSMEEFYQANLKPGR